MMENTITREELESIGEELFDEIARRNIDRSDVSKARNELNDLLKADKSHLVRKQITNKLGKRQTVLVNPSGLTTPVGQTKGVFSEPEKINLKDAHEAAREVYNAFTAVLESEEDESAGYSYGSSAEKRLTRARNKFKKITGKTAPREPNSAFLMRYPKPSREDNNKAVIFDPETGMFKANVVKNPNDRLILPVVAPRIPMTGTFWNLSDGRDPGVNTIQ